MVCPFLGAWIEKERYGAIQRVKRDKVRPLITVAFEASQGKIVRHCLLPVLYRNKMVNMVRKGGVILMNMTKLTVAASPLDDKLAERRWDVNPAHGA